MKRVFRYLHPPAETNPSWAIQQQEKEGRPPPFLHNEKDEKVEEEEEEGSESILITSVPVEEYLTQLPYSLQMGAFSPPSFREYTYMMEPHHSEMVTY